MTEKMTEGAKIQKTGGLKKNEEYFKKRKSRGRRDGLMDGKERAVL